MLSSNKTLEELKDTLSYTDKNGNKGSNKTLEELKAWEVTRMESEFGNKVPIRL